MNSVFEILLKAAKNYGDRVALKDSCEKMTYRELLTKSVSVSQEIKGLLQGKNNLILVVSSKSIRSVVAFWSVVASGNFYVAVDSKTPVHRFDDIIKNINPQLIIYTDDSRYDGVKNYCKSITIGALGNEYYTDFCESLRLAERNLARNHNISVDPLYMVFTSGSTGSPKAIVKSHQSILEFTKSFINEFDLEVSGENEVIGNQASFDFDVSAKDIYVAASLGATLCIIPNKCFLMPNKLASYLIENEITILIWSASAVKYVKKFNCFSKEVPSKLKRVLFSGESMSEECISYWREYLPEAIFVNMYAPSEVTGNCLFYIVEEETKHGILPLEKTFSNVDVLVLNEDNEQISDGEKGEIYVRGCFLAQGYYGDKQQTALRFIQNPQHDKYPDLVYKTGDFVTLEDGKYYFSGRIDNQIKHMGHRIELEEIENKIYEIFKLDYICIVYDQEREKIILVVENEEVKYEEIVKELRYTLPKYMIPHEIVYLRKIPLNLRGKVDRLETLKLYEESRK